MATQTGSIDLTASNGVKLMAEAGFESIEENYATKAELDVQADRIGMVVANNDASSSLQLTADAMTYIGNNVTIKGTDGTSTVISGGQIQTGSLSIGAFDSAAQSATLNSNISVGGRNLLQQSWRETQSSVTNSGITYTCNANGSITLNGTSTAMNVFVLAQSMTLSAGTYTLSGCPEGGGTNSYRLDILAVPLVSGTTESVADNGSGMTFETTGGTTGQVRIRVASGQTLSNLTFWPKLEKGNIATDWTPAPEDVQNELDNLSGYIRTIVPFNNAFDDTSKWYTVPNASTWTKLSDGWARCSYTNDGSSVSSTYVVPMAEDIIDAYDGGEFTFLVEFRNVSFGTATPSGNFAYIQQMAGAQFWGNTVNSADGFASTTYVTYADVSSGSYTHRFVKPVDANSGTGSYAGLMFRYRFYLPANTTTTFEVRISIYPARYLGGYTESLAVAAADSIVDASKTATSYVTKITGQNGIMVHPSTDDDTGVRITSDVDIMRDGNSVLNVGTQGDTTSTDAGVTIYDGTASRNVVASFDSDEVSLGANSNSSTIDMCGGAFKFSIDASDPNNVTGLIKVDQNAIDDHTANTPSILIAAGTSTLGRGIEIRGTSGAQYPVSIGEYDHGSIAQHVGLGSLGVKTPGIFFDGEGTVEAYSGVYVKSLTGTNFWSTVPGTVLWSGGYYMTASHTANLSHNISTCPTGIVLHFQPYTSSTVQNYYHQYCFVPKTTSFAAIHNFTLCTTGFTKVGMKALRIYDDRIVGDDANDDTGTASGITFANNYWVMTQVIAV